MKGGAIDEVRVFRTALTPIEVRHLHTQESAATRQQIVDVLAANDTRVEQAPVALTSARNVENDLVSVLPQIMIMGETPTPRPTYVLVRGNYEDHGEQVPPRGLNQVLPWDPAWPENRIGLARWLFDARNPLTARVFVNRAWQMHFGRGLVETAEDFGPQGSIPTQPELLDSLAVSFRESGWNIKKLHKLIVMSGTYRQQSDVTEAALQKDPTNLLLAHYTRLRMPAEMVRDQALAVSGLLVKRIGGPSVYPYQPPNMWDGFNVSAYPRSNLVPADEHHRRSMYSFVSATRRIRTWRRSTCRIAAALRPAGVRRTRRCRRWCCSTIAVLEAYRTLASRVLTTESAADARSRRSVRLATRRHPARRRDGRARVLRHAGEAVHADRDAASAGQGWCDADPSGVDIVQLAALTNVVR